MKLERITLKLLAENCYIYHNNSSCVIFDPGSDFEYIKQFIENLNLKVEYILLTHTHFDHIGAVHQLSEYFKSPVLCHKGEEIIIKNANSSTKYYGLPAINIPKIDKYIEDNEVIIFNDTEIKVIHTPGHTSGGVCYYIKQDNILISGDTLFLESIGRTDFETGSFDELHSSIVDKLYKLPDETKVYPGHGFHTTIGHEKQFNPYIEI